MQKSTRAGPDASREPTRDSSFTKRKPPINVGGSVLEVAPTLLGNPHGIVRLPKENLQ
ncbi:MAG: hypothetical protein WBM53_14360 [Maribacter sp.]